MLNVKVHRYADTSHGFAGWIEPDDKSWILFIPVSGEPQFFSKRDPVTGACL
jgi:hypothetical protein